MGRAAKSALCLAATLAAFVGVPALHLIHHDEDHIHVDGGIVYSRGQHHDDQDDHDDHHDHGDGGLAHFHAAALSAELPIEPLPVFTAEDVLVARELASARSVLSPHRARAPPSA